MKVLLIVDDEAYARQAVANTIPWAEHGVEVHQVSSGKEALDFMEKRTVDVLMTDIRMPSMTGLELLEKVYQNGWSPAAIVLSSFNEFELVRSAMQLGAEDYLFKPTMMPTDILKSVQRVLEKKKETKKKTKRKILIFVIILVSIIFIRTEYYNYKFNHQYKSAEETINNKNIDSINYLETLANENPDIAKIMKNKDSYPKILLEMLSRNLDMTDYVLNYLDYKGQVFSNDIGKVTKGKYPLLLQYDTRWGYGMYGDDVIAINGCGPTSLAMIIAGLTGRNDITPYDIATYSYQKGYYTGGTSWSLFTEGTSKYGIIGTEIPLSKASIINELEQNHPIICSMKKGDFTTTGHIITIVGTKNKQFIINDPNSRERSNELWSYETLEPQIRNLWSFRLK